MENINAVDMLKEELKKDLQKEHSHMIPAKEIITYLISKCEGDEAFSDRVNLENKSLKECLEYTLQEVKKKLNNQNGYLPDQEVYAMAESYYTLDEVVIEKPKATNYKKMKEIIKEVPQEKTNTTLTVQSKKVVKHEKEQISLFDF